jgi:predicted TIM-barrel fold metal-dependent hydrolase
MFALDIHAHVRTGDRRLGGDSWSDAQSLFKVGDVATDDIAKYYASLDMRAVIFDVQGITSHGQRASNEEVASIADASDGTLIGFAAIDPWMQRAALDELEKAVELGLRGVKVHPVTQAFEMNDHRFDSLWDFCSDHRLPVLVHCGTTGIGAGSPGGRGFQLKYGRVVPYIDDVAARFPNLNIIVAHFAWPWYEEALAVSRHKGNVFIDLSGWAPKYLPEIVRRYAGKVMPNKFLFGSDYPLLTPERWVSEFMEFEFSDSAKSMILRDNACELLGIQV